MTFVWGAVLAAGLLLMLSPWMWPAGTRPRQDAARRGRLSRLLEDAGMPREGRPFSAHLTLARWRDSRPSDRRRAAALDRPMVIARSIVDHATLYRSQLSSDGPTYTALARATLKACPPL